MHIADTLYTGYYRSSTREIHLDSFEAFDSCHGLGVEDATVGYSSYGFLSWGISGFQLADSLSTPICTLHEPISFSLPTSPHFSFVTNLHHLISKPIGNL
jgi:hypothetical protein